MYWINETDEYSANKDKQFMKSPHKLWKLLNIICSQPKKIFLLSLHNQRRMNAAQKEIFSFGTNTA